MCYEQRYGRIGVAIGTDEWYPEVARALVLHGAEMLLYPSAMGSNQYDLNYDARDQWQRTMQGHAAANMVPVICSNRVGTEIVDGVQVTFVGSSFITGQTGEMVSCPRVSHAGSGGVSADTVGECAAQDRGPRIGGCAGRELRPGEVPCATSELGPRARPPTASVRVAAHSRRPQVNNLKNERRYASRFALGYDRGVGAGGKLERRRAGNRESNSARG